METLLSVLVGLVVGALLGWLIASLWIGRNTEAEREKQHNNVSDLEKAHASSQATLIAQLDAANERLREKQGQVERLTAEISKGADTVTDLQNKLSISSANLLAANESLAEKKAEILAAKTEAQRKSEESDLKNQALATAVANNTALNEKLESQKAEIEALGKKFNLEFENIANKILETKTEKFTELNKTNLKTILDPLGKNIDEFKKTVNETYDKESKERFSLGEKVRELAILNQVISDEAKNLTKALKGEAKTQGRWGEMILESILERSGLRKDEEYFMEEQLLDTDGNPLRSDSENKKMRPDVVIKYPGNRNIIVDSKVSLNAFTRFSDSTDIEEQKVQLAYHVQAVKNHIVALSTKGYDDFDKSLDSVMMFIPSEPAYMAALQGDPELWNFAYDKRILLVNPTNLIVSLKLVADLWKREYQNKNAQEIADRGAKMYDKFVGFVENLSEVGKHLDKSKEAYTNSLKQLSTGNDNLVLQATKLKNLGLKNKKELTIEVEEGPTTPLLTT